MATLDSLLNPGVSEEVDPTFRAGRVSIRPLEYQTLQGKILGHYSAAGTSSALAFGASANLAAFRWTDPTNFCVIQRVYASVQVVTAVTAQRVDALLLFVARGYTARDATGATAVSFANPNTNKLRSTMGTTLMTSGNFDVTSAAGGVTAGTKTVDASPVGVLGLSGSAAIAGLGTGAAGELYSYVRPAAHPIVLAANEGILVQWGATAAATGTLTITVQVEWSEVATF